MSTLPELKLQRALKVERIGELSAQIDATRAQLTQDMLAVGAVEREIADFDEKIAQMEPLVREMEARTTLYKEALEAARTQLVTAEKDLAELEEAKRKMFGQVLPPEPEPELPPESPGPTPVEQPTVVAPPDEPSGPAAPHTNAHTNGKATADLVRGGIQLALPDKLMGLFHNQYRTAKVSCADLVLVLEQSGYMSGAGRLGDVVSAAASKLVAKGKLARPSVGVYELSQAEREFLTAKDAAPPA